jgi:Arc/MetJ-type ribon-helix-helix transcriptional regulator
MSTTIQTELSDKLFQQAQSMVERGWVSNMDELIAESIRRYLESHQESISERFIKEDIEWGLHGQE